MIFWKRFCFFFIFFPAFCFGQAGNDSLSKPDSVFKPNFSITINPARMIFDDLAVYGEFHFIKRLSAGISGGKIYDSNRFKFIVSDHAGWPGPIYDGYEFKTYLKFYPFFKNLDSPWKNLPNETNQFYFSLLYQYVNKSYSRQRFYDTEGRDIMYREIERSESQSQNNFYLLVGKTFHSGHFIIDLFIGGGERIAIEDYTNYYSFTSMQARRLKNVPIGSFHDMFSIAIFSLGIKIGFNSLRSSHVFGLFEKLNPKNYNYSEPVPVENKIPPPKSDDYKYPHIPK